MSNMTNVPEQFAAAVCPQCGGQLKVEPGQKFVECPYCHTISRTVDVHYHQHQNTNYSFSGSNTTVQFNAGQDLETLVKNAETHIKLGNYDNAEKLYKKITEEYPQDYRGWWGLVLSSTENLSSSEHPHWEIINSYWKSVNATAPQKIKEQLRIQLNEYEYACSHYRWWNKIRTSLRNELNGLTSRQANIERGKTKDVFKAIGFGLMLVIALLFLGTELLPVGIILTVVSVYKLFIKFDKYGKRTCIGRILSDMDAIESCKNEISQLRQRITQEDSKYRRPPSIPR